jgi:hypothetical protein
VPQELATDAELEAGEASEPAAWAGEIGDEAAADRIGPIREYDRQRAAHGQQASHYGRGHGED